MKQFYYMHDDINIIEKKMKQIYYVFDNNDAQM
jgi:hypothetical protein